MKKALPAMFLHGLESTSQGEKALVLKERVPALIIPDFHGTLSERMDQLEPLLAAQPRWMLVGSSFGGLMAATYAQRHPERVERLILLAPALHRSEYQLKKRVSIPTLWVHGTADTVVPMAAVAEAVAQAFSDVTCWVVEDDHRLRATSRTMDWGRLLDAQLESPWKHT